MTTNTDKLNTPNWVNWVAQDEDGCWWGYEVEPQEYGCGWYENELGRRIRLKKDPNNPLWRTTLVKLPQ